MVEILYGRAGTGKTYTLMKKIETYSKSGTSVCLVVPEQLSMTRELEINSRGLKGVSVLSFTRLANTVFRALGGTAKKHPDKAMVSAAVFRAVGLCYDRLTYFKSTAYTHGFISALISAFSEFDTNRMSEDEILSIPDNEWSARAKNKYRDMFMIYSEYKALWRGEYKDPADDITYAASLLELNDIYKDTVFLFDGFFGFTPQQLVLVEQLVLQSPYCTFAFTTDMESDIFLPVTREVKKLLRITSRHKIKSELVSAGDTCFRLNSPALKEAEKSAFLTMPPKSDKQLSGVSVYLASNINDELNYIACKIKNDVLDGKYRFCDIAVLSPDAESIRTLMASVFDKHRIPAFTDTGSTLLSHPLTAFVLSAFDIAIYGFEFENVFSFLKTGLAGISFDDISLLESYVRMWKIRDKGWKEDVWTRNPDGIGNAFETDTERLDKINKLKDAVRAPLLKFKAAVSGKKTASDILYAVYALTEDFNVRDNLTAVAKDFKASGDIRLYDEYTRVYGVFVDMLDSIYAISDGLTTSARRFYDLLCVSAAAVTLSGRPARTDEVLFASLGQARAEGKKCVYIPCMNGGILPSPSVGGSLITEADKRVFNRFDIDVSMDAEASSAREHFDLYCAVTSPSDELVLSYSAFRVSGEALTRSEYLDSIIDACGAREIRRDDLGCEFFLVSVAGATDEAARTGNGEIFAAVEKASGISGYTEKTADTTLSDSVVKGLYSRSLRLSFSGMEEYVNCPFKFFVDRGLRAGKNEPVEFNPANIGTFIHRGLELLLEGGYDISTPEAVKKAVDVISDDYCNNELADLKGRSRRFDYLFSRARYALSSAAENVAEEIRNSDFKPFEFEVDISQYSPPVMLEKGYTLTLVGSIDRVDMTDDGYAKIVDYKSGSQKFSFEKIYNGLSMQLPVYASAIRAKSPDAKIAAMYYLKVGIPSVKSAGAAGMTEEEYAASLAKYYTRDGVFSTEGGIISRLDKSGKLFPPIKKERVVSDGEMSRLIDFTAERIKKTGLGITSGNADISPVCDRDVDACRYCDYSSICGITDDDDRKRTLLPLPDGFLKD